VSCGSLHALALRADGTVVAWGENNVGQINVPAGLTNVVQIACGYAHSLALRSDGSVVAWGWNNYGQTSVPSNLGAVVKIGSGPYHSLAIRSDGTMAAWGFNNSSQSTIPVDLTNTQVVDIAGTYNATYALRANGTMLMWGANYTYTVIPSNAPTNVVQIACFNKPLMALRQDGTIFAWNESNGAWRSLTNVTKIVALATWIGAEGGLALRSNGAADAWGATIPLPALRAVIDIDGSEDFGVALTALEPDIILSRSNGAEVASGAAAEAFEDVLVGTSSVDRTYTVRNGGDFRLSGLTMTKQGSHRGDFSVGSLPDTLLPGQSTNITVSFVPTSGGAKSSYLEIRSNDPDPSENPFVLNLSGYAVSTELDMDGDGLNDKAEFTMATLGFNHRVAQPQLVSTLFNNAIYAGLYTSNSIIDLKLGSLMLQKQGSNAVITLQPQTTTDLTQPFTNNGPPITNQILMPGDKSFIRIKAN
jgi:hypothetical protein